MNLTRWFASLRHLDLAFALRRIAATPARLAANLTHIRALNDSNTQSIIAKTTFRITPQNITMASGDAKIQYAPFSAFLRARFTTLTASQGASGQTSQRAQVRIRSPPRPPEQRLITSRAAVNTSFPFLRPTNSPPAPSRCFRPPCASMRKS